jgi:hypothetical protein
MLTNGWVRRHNPIVLKVNIELNKINSSAGWFKDNIDGIEPKEFRYFLNIKPQNIKIVNIDFKKFKLEY